MPDVDWFRFKWYAARLSVWFRIPVNVTNSAYPLTVRGLIIIKHKFEPSKRLRDATELYYIMCRKVIDIGIS